MRTVNKVGGVNGLSYTEFYGNSTDIKPTDDTVPNGSVFYEIDNNMQEYRWDKEGGEWKKIESSGGGGGGGNYLPLSGGTMSGDIDMGGNQILKTNICYANFEGYNVSIGDVVEQDGENKFIGGLSLNGHWDSDNKRSESAYLDFQVGLSQLRLKAYDSIGDISGNVLVFRPTYNLANTPISLMLDPKYNKSSLNFYGNVKNADEVNSTTIITKGINLLKDENNSLLKIIPCKYTIEGEEYISPELDANNDYLFINGTPIMPFSIVNYEIDFIENVDDDEIGNFKYDYTSSKFYFSSITKIEDEFQTNLANLIIADPIDDSDASTKKYVDNLVSSQISTAILSGDNTDKTFRLKSGDISTELTYADLHIANTATNKTTTLTEQLLSFADTTTTAPYNIRLYPTISNDKPSLQIFNQNGSTNENVVLKNIETPIEDNDAVNKGYVDSKMVSTYVSTKTFTTSTKVPASSEKFIFYTITSVAKIHKLVSATICLTGGSVNSYELLLTCYLDTVTDSDGNYTINAYAHNLGSSEIDLNGVSIQCTVAYMD